MDFSLLLWPIDQLSIRKKAKVFTILLTKNLLLSQITPVCSSVIADREEYNEESNVLVSQSIVFLNNADVRRIKSAG